MSLDGVMALTNRLLTSADALAAITARLRLDELGDGGDPALRVRLDRIVDALEARELLDALDAQERKVVVAFAHSYLRQALDLVEDPLRESAWSYTDPVLLQAQGSASGAVAKLFEAAGIGAPDARILDVGVGVAGLAIAFCATYPESTVVGLDPWEPSLEIARQNVEEAGLGSRITLLPTPIQEFNDEDGFDLVWLPSFFIPESVLDDAVARIYELLRPGGTLVVGSIQGEEGSLDVEVDNLRTIRSGGSVVTSEDALVRLGGAGFADVHEAELGPGIPLRLAVGTRA